MVKQVYGYVRVSKSDGSQTTDNQVPDLERLASARGWTINKIFKDEMSGSRAQRPGLEALKKTVRAGDVVLIWRLDRLGRSMINTLTLVQEFDSRGIQLVSLSEPWLDTTGPMRSLLLSVFTWFAEYEKTTLIERTKAGLARARAEGVRIGRPRASATPMAEALALVDKGESLRAAAKATGISAATIGRAARARSAASKGSTIGPPAGPPESQPQG